MPPVRRLWLDIETYSTVDLRTANVYRYAEDPAFEVLMCAWSDGGPIRLAFGNDEVAQIPGLFDPAVLKTSHNAAFERVCLSRLAGLPAGRYLDPVQWRDTAAIAAEHGLPRSLGKLAEALGAEPKDEAGTRLINLFCKPDSTGRRTMPHDAPLPWVDFVRYCVQDTATLMDVDARLGNWPTRAERDLFHVDQRINDRGMAVDVELARRAVTAGAVTRAQQMIRLRELTSLENPGSVIQLSGWIRGRGVAVDDLRAATVAALLAGELPDDVREVLTIRSDLALAAPKKFQAALDSVGADGRIRGAFRFFGAHTGRFSGKGLQPHNLPRAGFKAAEESEAIRRVKAGEPADAETLKKLVRSMFVGPLTVVDYASIEARVVAWLAGETWALDAFAQGRDIYVETAERMSTPGHKLTRQQGKVASLALGFGGGVGSLKVMGADGSEDELQALVDRWRKANPRIVRLWRALDDAFRIGGRAGARLRVQARGSQRLIVLPSGRAITYHGVTTGKRMTFKDPRGFRADTYGGRLTENCLAGETRVLTERGWVEIRSVSGSDRIWDGLEWVTHGGLLYKGERQTMNVSGVRLTPDHRILTTRGWIDASSCDGLDRAEVRLPHGHLVRRLNGEEVPEGGGVRLRCAEDPRHVRPEAAESVYDLVNAGPRRRFTVLGADGPMLVHNCTQAVARDVLGHALIELDRAGYPVVGHVHDEVILDGSYPVDEVAALMCTMPPWADGLPLGAEGFQAPRYRKG